MYTESYVYLLTNKHLNVLYTRVTNNLIRRIYEHRNKLVRGFTQKYNVDRLVYYEACENIIVAIAREKQIKGWSRKKKDALISVANPQWEDLYRSLY
ncbi:GIY-YIG nuclease family protein [Legionella clemsonensis]|uniref:GIY-YIG nuclease superfamily protein n=1 Tax=Legionella clemsonensis TaxID=1867846 RepID=A0A222P3E2_9GAMM|nr:GIY-YIG nuclease family protein [Legionella clemsonensis]ASQ46347.1 GIY-YIG nuclease superfamily protein [Legionella clemsonensis]